MALKFEVKQFTQKNFKQTLEMHDVGGIVQTFPNGVLLVRCNSVDIHMLEIALQKCKPAGILVKVQLETGRSYYGVTFRKPSQLDKVVFFVKSKLGLYRGV